MLGPAGRVAVERARVHAPDRTDHARNAEPLGRESIRERGRRAERRLFAARRRPVHRAVPRDASLRRDHRAAAEHAAQHPSAHDDVPLLRRGIRPRGARKHDLRGARRRAPHTREHRAAAAALRVRRRAHAARRCRSGVIIRRDHGRRGHLRRAAEDVAAPDGRGQGQRGVPQRVRRPRGTERILLYEFGAAVHRGPHNLDDAARALTDLADTLPAMVIDTLREQLQRIRALTGEIRSIERRLSTWKRANEAATRLAAIPGVGLLTATAAIATIGDANTFRSGREFAAFIGLVPRQSGTGGRVKLLGISKRGDVYLRTLLIHGARSVLAHRKHLSDSLQRLIMRRPFNVAVVALANKMARTIWALLARERTYQPGYVAHAT
ncbi:IS110 family transposase [Paraburkholderia youngii]|uniref:IS110 family transposase n=1 Tax=Paraburkholderia youngii TaxID=2782701 RepID=UPI003D1A50AA